MPSSLPRHLALAALAALLMVAFVSVRKRRRSPLADGLWQPMET